MVTLDQAFAYLRDNCALEVIAATAWSVSDIRAYEAATGLKIPDQLRTVLMQVGHCGVESNDAFIVTHDDGSRSVHESQILVSSRNSFMAMHQMFMKDDPWPNQFTLPMVFFGTADAGHSYLLMDGTNPENGEVYFWERATDPFGTGDNAKGVAKVADSLAEFFMKLTAPDKLQGAIGL